MTWRVAEALLHLRDQVNAKYPGRSKESDGTIGNAEHASRSSDHNPWVKEGPMGIVTAMDLTHDPAHGFNSYAFADMLLTHRDARIKYVISNKRIGAGNDGPQPWTWRPYHGANTHEHHVHISVKDVKSFYDRKDDWLLTALLDAGATAAEPYVAPPKTIKYGSVGAEVKQLQTMLKIDVDGDFGPKTEMAVKAFQHQNNLVPDGIVGPTTWTFLAKG